ncbi:sulfotransferase family protein [Coprobacter tertius]|uniref:Sulfotransferase n=1 Tax=Coprobacter tertius TaxID=2944915 RepID=A0ABT1MK77_9BACT|nr:sulfotransferase [Coprobacter tertius]MCP9612841.1 sulfotransferase [Coprobacter tertius]
MGLIEFDKLPINTLVGADWKTFKAITDGKVIDKNFRKKYILTKSVCRLLSSLNGIEEHRYNKLLADKELETDPMFILGHWRSGTTFVHNVFSCDKHFGYNTTYQTVFPHLMLWGQGFFKKNMSFLMPDKRPTDNMELKVDLPQEEEFALTNMMPYSFYNFWFLPKHTMEYCDKYLIFETISEKERQVFKEQFLKLIKISLYNTQGTQFLSKNPPHTGRVKTLLEMFPNAKFIYLKRNPYTVFESTRSFFTNTIQPLRLQDISNEQIEKNVIEVYKKLFYKFEEEKHLIPENNLIEVKFEDFEADAFDMTQHIYQHLKLEGFETSKAEIEKYLGKKKGYKKNQYKYDERTVKTVEENWGFALEKWGYNL